MNSKMEGKEEIELKKLTGKKFIFLLQGTHSAKFVNAFPQFRWKRKMQENIPSEICVPHHQSFWFWVFLESTWGTGHRWAMKFLSWFQTSMWGIENRDIKLSPHPIPAKWENMFEQGPVSMFWQDTWTWKSGTYILTDGSPNLPGGILKPKWN